jgi:hypothetical protein
MHRDHLRRQRPVRQDGRMADRYRTKDGWSVEIVQPACTPDHHDGEWLRIKYFGYHVQLATCATSPSWSATCRCPTWSWRH